MALSRRVRVSRIVRKRKILRLLLAMIAGNNRQYSQQQKGVFLLVTDFWQAKILARNNER